MSRLRYEMGAGIEPFLPAKNPPITHNPSAPITKPILKKQPAPKGNTNNE
jgi:hypothetical protein